jgi:hypothetical protein
MSIQVVAVRAEVMDQCRTDFHWKFKCYERQPRFPSPTTGLFLARSYMYRG